MKSPLKHFLTYEKAFHSIKTYEYENRRSLHVSYVSELLCSQSINNKIMSRQ